MKNTLLFFLSFFCLLSCDKDELSDFQKGIINGVVVDKTTGDPIANAMVYLNGYEITGNIGTPGPTFNVATTTSDSDGKFHFDFNYSEVNGYFCSGFSEMYFDYQEEFTIDDNVNDGNVNVEITLQPIAWMNIHIKSINTYAASDYLSVSNIGTFYGNDVDTSVSDVVLGNFYNSVVWGVVVDGVPPAENESEDIYCPSFDTTYYEILY